MTEYKPGTVAYATVRGCSSYLVARSADGYWTSATKVDGRHVHLDDLVTDVRPLVVLDLDASERAALRKRALESFDFHCVTVRAIEQQTKPPKPEEPQAVGVLVRDRNGDVWAHTAWGLWDDLTSEARCRKWCDIDAVEIVREGVTP